MSKVRKQSGRTYNAEATRAAILDAAEADFAAHGYAGARIDVIAATSGYNKSLIFQYFGDKLRLYTAVLRRADHETAALRAQVFAPLLTQQGLATDAVQLRAFFEQAFRALFDYVLDHQRLLRIVLWEMADGWQTYARIQDRPPPEGLSPLDHLFREGYSAGLIRSPLAPLLQLTLALHICQTAIASLPLLQLLESADAGGAGEHLGAVREYTIQLIVSGILVDHH